MRLVTTLLASNLEALAVQAAKAMTTWVEVRLDAFQDLEPEDLPAIRKAVPQRAIATCRTREEGGRHLLAETTREELLEAALDAGFDAIDVEAAAHFCHRLAEAASQRGAEVIVSRHEARRASLARAEDVAQFLDRAPRDAIVKYAAPVEAPDDLVALLHVAARARTRGLRFAVMGLGDASLRLLAPAWGGELVYCAPPEGPAAAPGQLAAATVAEAHALLPPRAAVSGRHRLVALLGDPVAHSLSPAMQNAAFAAAQDPLVYVAVRASRARVGRVLAGLRAAGFAGANVTAPLKEAVLPHLDSVDESAAAARSVNTISVRRGKVRGHTTDGAGAVAALRDAAVAVEDATALVLGAGGTGRSVTHALRGAGARVLVANRTLATARALGRAAGVEAIPWRKADLETVASRATLLVHCTSLGRDRDTLPIPAGLLRPGLAVLDAVYRPGGTPLVRAARATGALAVPGEALLLHQGALAYTLWTGRAAPLGPMRAALATASSQEAA